MSLENRLDRIESALGPLDAPDPWEGRDDTVKAQLASFGLTMAVITGDHLKAEGKSFRDPEVQAECQAVCLAASDALAARLDAEGLGHAPLDDTGKARVRVIADELERVATVPQILVAGEPHRMRPSATSWRSPRLTIPDIEDLDLSDDVDPE